MSHCCDLPHCDIPAPSPAPALEATSSAVLCPIVLLSARAAGHVRNYRPRLVGTSPTNRSGRSELITSRPAEVTTEAAIERRHVRQQDAVKVHRGSSPNDAKAEWSVCARDKTWLRQRNVRTDAQSRGFLGPAVTGSPSSSVRPR